MRPYQQNLLGLGQTHSCILAPVNNPSYTFGLNICELFIADDGRGFETCSTSKNSSRSRSDYASYSEQKSRVLFRELSDLPPCVIEKMHSPKPFSNLDNRKKKRNSSIIWVG